MKLTANLSAGLLTVDGNGFPISNNIRTLRDGTRHTSEVVRSIPANAPYDPQHFPKGTWNITGLDWQKEKGFDPRTYGPVKIKTDAWQAVKVWELDDEGDYLRETERFEPDTAYWLHYSVYNTTLGCIRLASAENAVAIANIIQSAMSAGEVCILEVI